MRSSFLAMRRALLLSVLLAIGRGSGTGAGRPPRRRVPRRAGRAQPRQPGARLQPTSRKAAQANQQPLCVDRVHAGPGRAVQRRPAAATSTCRGADAGWAPASRRERRGLLPDLPAGRTGSGPAPAHIPSPNALLDLAHPGRVPSTSTRSEKTRRAAAGVARRSQVRAGEGQAARRAVTYARLDPDAFPQLQRVTRSSWRPRATARHLGPVGYFSDGAAAHGAGDRCPGWGGDCSSSSQRATY